MRDRHDLPCDDLRPPDPPPELRQRTLIAARKALERGNRLDVWARLWGSRTVRMVWAASVGCLLFGHVVVSNGVGSDPTPQALPLAVVAGGGDELAEVAALPRVTASLPGFEVSMPQGEAEREED